jgi:cubilin
MNLFLIKFLVTCGGELNGLNGTISSPNYPSNYASRLRCLWTISVPPNYIIKLIFVEFQTEYCDDYVDIFDGKFVNSSLIDKFCGNSYIRTISPVVSSSNFMTIRFITDGGNNFIGFSAQYRAVQSSKFYF